MDYERYKQAWRVMFADEMYLNVTIVEGDRVNYRTIVLMDDVTYDLFGLDEEESGLLGLGLESIYQAVDGWQEELPFTDMPTGTD